MNGRLTAIALGLGMLFSQFALGQATTSVKPTTPHPAAVECEKRFREGEIRLGVPHQAGALKEVCQNVRESCLDETAKEPDCDRAKRDMVANITQSMKFRDPHGKRP